MTGPDRWPEAQLLALRYWQAWGTVPDSVRAWLPGGILPEELPVPEQLGGWVSGAALDVPDPDGFGGDEEDE